MNRTRVAIICGGKSSEHEISCVSASGVLAAIDREKFDPLLIGITKLESGSFYLSRQALLLKMDPFLQFQKLVQR